MYMNESSIEDSFIYKSFNASNGLIEKIVKYIKTSVKLDKTYFEEQYFQMKKTNITPLAPKVIEALDNGSIEILYSKDELRMGYMLQNDTLFPWLNILDNCLLGVKIKKEVTKENIDRVKVLLETYGLSDFAYKYPRNLSGGMRQRVALIRTLAINPDILLLDEPFSALDYQTRLAVSDDVWKIIKKEKKTTIMITHDVAEAISMADRVVVLSNRPAKVKSIYNIEMMNKSTPIGNRNTEEFKDYYDKIWKDIDFHV